MGLHVLSLERAPGGGNEVEVRTWVRQVAKGSTKLLPFSDIMDAPIHPDQGGGGDTQVMGNLFYWEMGLHNWGPRQAAAPSLCENQAQARGDCRWISMRLSHARMDLKEALYRTRSAHTLTVPHGMYARVNERTERSCMATTATS